jgi:plasmid stabilization system protein ParE
MSLEVIFRSKAKYDLEDIKVHYKNISSKLVSRFSSEFYESLDHIKNNPHLYQVKYRDIRIASLHNFPYGIHYVITLNHIIILRVLHTSRYFE